MTYTSFIKTIQDQLDAFERSIRDESVRLANLETAWSIGKAVYHYKNENGTSVKAICKDCGVTDTQMNKFVRFYRFYPKTYKSEIKGKPLNWSHYAAILYLRSDKERNFYLKEAALNDWSSHQLRLRISNNFYESSISCHPELIEGSKQALRNIPQSLYTYKATVLKVVDGDTLKVEIDVGFSMRYEAKLRLRGINCPEKGTPKGDEAKTFVESVILSENVSFPRKRESSVILSLPKDPIIVIKTYKSGKFGRFISDVYYMKGETNPEVILKKGRLLNQELLNKGHAEKVE